MSIKLDLSQFKHIKSDDNATTLQHKQGHTLTLAHKSLSPANQKALQALAQSSMTQPEAQEEQVSKMAEGGKPAEQMSPSTNSPASPAVFAEGGEAKKPTPYGKVVIKDDKPEPIGKVIVKEDKPQPIGKVKVQKFAEKGEVEEPEVEAPAAADSNDNPMDPGGRVAAEDADQEKLAKSLEFNLPQAQADMAQKAVPPIQQATRDMYNRLAGSNPGDPTAPIVDPGVNSFGLDGSAPKNFRPEIWAQAEQAIKEKAEGDQAAKAQNAADIQQQNAVRARAGLDPLPIPQGVPATPQVDAMQQTGAIPPDQGNTSSTSGGAAATPQPGTSFDPESMLKSGYQSSMAGIAGEAQAKGALGEQQAAQYQNQIDIQKQAQQHYQNSINSLNTERQNFIDDIRNGHINPEQYWTGVKNPQTGEMEGGHSKIATGIGMILAGFNPTNNPNAAINFLKYQMDKNMEGQIQNLGAKKSLLQANVQQFQNLNQATEMTRLMQNDALSNQIQMEAAKATSPIAKAAAQQAIGTLQMDSSQKFRQLALMNAMTNIAKDPNANPDAMGTMLGYMRAVNPEMAKTYDQIYVPGVGLAKVPVPESVRGEINAKNSLDSAANDLLAYSKKHTNIVPGTAEYNYGVAKSLAFQQKVREGLLGTVFRESEKPLLEKFVNDSPAGALKSFTTQPKLRAIIDSNRLGLNQLKQTYGLPVPQQSAGPQIKTVNGVQYMRGPNGQAIPVKQGK